MCTEVNIEQHKNEQNQQEVVIKLNKDNLVDTIAYRAEGNANIVVALNKTRQVIRFRKTNKTDNSIQG